MSEWIKLYYNAKVGKIQKNIEEWSCEAPILLKFKYSGIDDGYMLIVCGEVSPTLQNFIELFFKERIIKASSTTLLETIVEFIGKLEKLIDEKISYKLEAEPNKINLVLLK